MPPMNVPIRGLPRPIYANFKEEDQKTEVTLMSNGLRVASENRFGEFCTVGGNIILLHNFATFIHYSFTYFLT